MLETEYQDHRSIVVSDINCKMLRHLLEREDIRFGSWEEILREAWAVWEADKVGAHLDSMLAARSYAEMSPTERVNVTNAIIYRVVDQSLEFRQWMNNPGNMNPLDLRIEPIGKDAFKGTYWYVTTLSPPLIHFVFCSLEDIGGVHQPPDHDGGAEHTHQCPLESTSAIRCMLTCAKLMTHRIPSKVRLGEPALPRGDDGVWFQDEHKGVVCGTKPLHPTGILVVLERTPRRWLIHEVATTSFPVNARGGSSVHSRESGASRRTSLYLYILNPDNCAQFRRDVTYTQQRSA